MKCSFNIAMMYLVVLLLGASASADDHAEAWFLMSRHGVCAEIETLERKIPDIKNIKSPDSFVALMKEKGLEVKLIQLKDIQGNAVQVDVPEKGLNLVFVKSAMCQRQ